MTALFRRPLGLPIPHTAIVVERKDRFAETLGTFVQESFLDPRRRARNGSERPGPPMRLAALRLADLDHASDLIRAICAELSAGAADLLRADEDAHGTSIALASASG